MEIKEDYGEKRLYQIRRIPKKKELVQTAEDFKRLI